MKILPLKRVSSAVLTAFKHSRCINWGMKYIYMVQGELYKHTKSAMDKPSVCLKDVGIVLAEKYMTNQELRRCMVNVVMVYILHENLQATDCFHFAYKSQCNQSN